ncbi:hypothetical protein [Sodalis-like endosymbiont of Proechinophthirus fluctus]|uniref:hypothetical protein n=1 Tax=Sodalis-like endosymbiont of Proechinophthirus fluctus TaxID=1462730 RepID=UPI003F74C0CB
MLIHNLFSSLDNLGVLAWPHRPLTENYRTMQIDLRNHDLGYDTMARDMLALLAMLLIELCIIYHSMGGKVAPALFAYWHASMRPG